MIEHISPAERESLEAGIGQLGVTVEDAAVSDLLGHVALIRKWAKSYNLVARGDLDSLIDRHVLDSLYIGQWLKGTHVLDVGSGAGFPGLPLAIINPGRQFILLDSSGKRVRFMRHAVRNLGLENVTVVQKRVEDYEPDIRFGSIVSRALASLQLFADRVRHLCERDTRVLAIKGRKPSGELSELPPWATVESIEPYRVPGLHAERHVVIMSLSSQRS